MADGHLEQPAEELSGEDLALVRLENVPLRFFSTTLRRHRDLMRECVLMQIGADHDGTSAPPRELVELVAELQAYRSFGSATDTLRDAAITRGESAATLVYRIPREVGAKISRLMQLYDAVDELSRDDRHLLSLPPTPESVALRRWYLGEFVRQAAGQPPTPWRG